MNIKENKIINKDKSDLSVTNEQILKVSKNEKNYDELSQNENESRSDKIIIGEAAANASVPGTSLGPSNNSDKETKQRVPEMEVDMNFERKQLQFSSNVLKFFLKSLTPFNLVESPEFLAMFHHSDAEMPRISEEHLSTQADFKFKIVKNKIITLLEGVDFVCIAFDWWSSKCRLYLAITCHWIDAVTFKRRSAALACKRFDGASQIFLTEKHIKQTLKNYKLPKHKIISKVTKNCYNFCKLFKDLNVPKISNTDIIDENISLPSQTMEYMDKVPYICYTNELSLIATIDIPNVIHSYPSLRGTYELIFKKVFSFLLLASSNATLAPMFADLKDPEVVKWNSFYNSIAYFLKLEQKRSFAELFDLLNIEPLTDEEIEYLNEYVNSLEPLATAFKRLQCEQGSYHGFILPTLVEMRKKCEKLLKNKDLTKFEPFLHAIVSGTSNRFYDLFTSNPESNRVIIASLSHPFFKANWVSAINGFKKETVKAIFLEAVANENSKSYDDNDDGRMDVHEENKCDQETDDFYFGVEEEQAIGYKKAQLSIKIEALTYLSDNRKNLKMLNDYPAVKRVFLKYNTSLSSSEAVEKIFPFETRQNIARYGSFEENLFEERVLYIVNKDVLVS